MFAALTLVKLLIAASLSPFGDEAFYWQESRRLAWGYSDLPPLTAWLIHLGEQLAGHGVFGMRWPFLLLGSAVPWLVVAFARRSFDERAGWQAGLLCLALPLAGSLGVLALPDVPLTFGIMLALFALLQALERDRRRDWLWLGIGLAVCWLAHYRAAMPMLAGLLLFVLTPRGRAQWCNKGFWLAMAVAGAGLLPLLISNWQQHGAGVVFQLVERNPWRFHADALVQPLEQALACTPLLYALLLWTAWQSWCRRKEGAPWDLIAISSLTFVLIYFGLGLFADDLRFRAHWALSGYLPLLAALPVLLRPYAKRRGWRAFVLAGFVFAALGQLGGMVYLGMAAHSESARMLAGLKIFPSRFVGWRESGDAARAWLAKQPGVLVADNFMLAAELDFQLDGRVPVYALDNPLNVKHGRAPQLAIWRRDEPALREVHPGEPMLLVVDEMALRLRERSDWLRSLCDRIDSPRPLQRLDLFDGRRRMAFYVGRVPAVAGGLEEDAGQCLIWRQASMAAAAGSDSGS
ncbi:ArnT family glycosyltransferase [Dyella silvatica]|uniref:ArnT family glycosyltransferase n=1 Tax=Dyella silvatica TaxID=2992128 RepID=UPI002254520D|nr:glycosyltransferase family 39 protein [Dyella silvatica]